MPRKKLRPGNKVAPNIYWRGPYQYLVRVYARGKRISETFRTKEEAEDWRDETKSELRGGHYVDRRSLKKVTVGDLLDKYIEDYVEVELGLANDTLSQRQQRKREANRAKHIKTYALAQKTLEEVDRVDIRGFLSERAKTRGRGGKTASNNTLRLDLALLKKMFSLAINDWDYKLKDNPTAGVSISSKRASTSGGRTRRLSPQEEKWALEMAPPEMQSIIKFALASAMRQREIARLSPGDIDIKKRTALLEVTKNGERRTVTLSKPAIAALKESGGLKGKGPIFGMTGDQISKAWTQLAKDVRAEYANQCAQNGDTPKSGFFEDIIFHDLRHESISRLFERTSLDSMRIAEITGHKDLKALKGYLHLRDTSQVIRALDAAFPDPQERG